jgi:hypothetical protein
MSGDKENYQNNFEMLSLFSFEESNDIGFSVFSYIIKLLIDDSQVYFLILAFFYVLGYFIFAKRFIKKEFIGYFLIASFLSFGFGAYGVNTIRAGFALAFFLIAVTYHSKISKFLFLSIIAVLIHKSLLLPVVAFFISKFSIKTRLYYYLWILCLLISALNITFISSFVEQIIGQSDDRFTGYLNGESLERYNVGFRIDFVIYSVIPILIGRWYIYKLNVNDEFYKRIFQTYLFANAIWLLVIRMAFTDRMAYLSWFLIPMILMYPILKYNLPINKKRWLFFILLGIFSFTSFMYFK